MQTMPAKTRTALAVAVALLAVVVGAVALWTGQSNNEPVDATAGLEQPGNTDTDGTAAQTDDTTDPMDSSETAGTDPTDTNSEPTATASALTSEIPEVHVVKQGDTLSSISQLYYGSHIYAGDIEELNMLDNIDMIYPGKELYLPRWDEINPAAVSTAAQPTDGGDADRGDDLVDEDE